MPTIRHFLLYSSQYNSQIQAVIIQQVNFAWTCNRFSPDRKLYQMQEGTQKQIKVHTSVVASHNSDRSDILNMLCPGVTSNWHNPGLLLLMSLLNNVASLWLYWWAPDLGKSEYWSTFHLVFLIISFSVALKNNKHLISWQTL